MAMIGIIADPAEESAVDEFFELFKVPWEYHRGDRQYQVVICAHDAKPDRLDARLVIVFYGDTTAYDEEWKIPIQSRRLGSTLSYAGRCLPIFGSTVTFCHSGSNILVKEGSRQCVAYVSAIGERMYARIGYDLFREVQALISQGQNPANAAIPTLDLHIAFLRDLIVGCGIPLLEIPPLPDRYPFITCLTHDVDHASIRRHKLDRTMFGFLYRATLQSPINLIRGRLSLTNLLLNWSAAARLPFVHLGLAKDFWDQFERYLAIDKGHPSTFFVIPFEGRPGRTLDGAAPLLRACRYDVSHIAAKIPELTSRGCEIGLHGIDAWIDSSKGREEAQRIYDISGISTIGVRMHWLYLNLDSPARLDEAGFFYDSTIGYNETVGYRAGTSQVFNPLPGRRILELPLHIMDTALFYPGRLNLSALEAWEKLAPMFDNAVRYGGVLTINWHDRSIAPERCWGAFYSQVLDCLENRGPWFATGTQAVHWFSRRRSVTFDEIEASRSFRVKVPASTDDKTLPSMRLRIHQRRGPIGPWHSSLDNNYDHRDICLGTDMDICVP